MNCPLCDHPCPTKCDVLNHCWTLHEGFYKLLATEPKNSDVRRVCVCGDDFPLSGDDFTIVDHWLAAPEEHLFLFRLGRRP